MVEAILLYFLIAFPLGSLIGRRFKGM